MVCFSHYNLVFVLLQIWPTTSAPGLLSGIYIVCGSECVLHLIHHVCHHEIFHGGGPRRDSYHLFCLK